MSSGVCEVVYGVRSRIAVGDGRTEPLDPCLCIDGVAVLCNCVGGRRIADHEAEVTRNAR